MFCLDLENVRSEKWRNDRLGIERVESVGHSQVHRRSLLGASVEPLSLEEEWSTRNVPISSSFASTGNGNALPFGPKKRLRTSV